MGAIDRCTPEILREVVMARAKAHQLHLRESVSSIMSSDSAMYEAEMSCAAVAVLADRPISALGPCIGDEGSRTPDRLVANQMLYH